MKLRTPVRPTERSPWWLSVTIMDFAMSAKAQDYHKRLSAFMTEFVFPAEAEYERYRLERGPDDHSVPPVIEELKKLARERGLWNLFLPSVSGLTNTDYAPLAELTGWSMEIAPEATNCAAPDTGNMETLHLFATEQQRKQWLEPLLAGEIRSAFSMTEPAVASSDARNIETSIVRDGSDYVINGRKWWTSGASDPRCKILIVMGRTNPDAASHQQQSMVLVPIDTPGVTVLRSTPVFGWQDQHGHCEVIYDKVRVPTENLLGEEGSGFAIAQARLGPGRIHHCMRAMGAAERALALMVDRARNRVGVRQTTCRAGSSARVNREVPQRDRPGQAVVREGGLDHRPARQQSRPPAGQPDQGGSTEGGLRRYRPRHPGARRGGRQRRHPAGAAVLLASGDADLRRARRGAYAHHRSRRNRPGEKRFRRGGHLIVPDLKGAWNFRDVADATGVRPGRFFRSSELSALEDDGRDELRALGVFDVADLRSPREVERRGPGRVHDDVAIHPLPFPDLAEDADGEAPHEHSFTRMLTEQPDDEPPAEAAVRYMTDEYRRFPTLGGARNAVRQVISLLASGRPVITHCFAGKDRTGFTVAVVLESLGVDRDAILDDYLRSNTAVPQLRERILTMVHERAGSELTPEAVMFAEARLSDEVLGVRDEYLTAARQSIDDNYGSLDAYLQESGVSPADIDALRTALL